MRIFQVIILVLFFSHQIKSQQYYKTEEGEAKFLSEAPLEVIQAKTSKLRGIIDKEKNSFAFVLQINSFKGFNSPLQQEHFNENYLESEIYPEATFTGKIIEKDALNQDGEFTLRAKGKLKIHGVEQERIIKCKVLINPIENSIQVNTFFTVFLES